MRNLTYAVLWAIAGGLMVAGAVTSLAVNVIFAMMFAGLAVALFLIALSCLLLDPRPRSEKPEAGHEPGDDDRRKWGPR